MGIKYVYRTINTATKAEIEDVVDEIRYRMLLSINYYRNTILH